MNSKASSAVIVRNLHKEFILPKNKNSTFKQSFVNIVKRKEKTVQKVLDGISFEVKNGDFFGIVGRNGSGKSTLLKLIAGVYTPTEGSIRINGGLTPFIELGVGFNPELSGRDNVFLNGALLGFSHKQMDEMYDDIVAFAELEPFMDQKLKNYSSGMQVRLAFSIAIKADNDILMFDEVLAVGDSNFQEKCIRQFKKFKKEGKTVILVTHSMEMVEKFCNRAILISNGKLEYDGDAEGAIDMYKALNMQDSIKRFEAIKEQAAKKMEIISADIMVDDREVSIINARSTFSIKMQVKSLIDKENVFAAIRICESENQFTVAGFDSEADHYKFDVKAGDNELIVKLDNNPFSSGKYYIVVGLYDSSKRRINYGHYNGMLNGRLFMVKGKDQTVGIVEISRKWGA